MGINHNAQADQPLMRKLINRFGRDEDGPAMVEYGLLVGLIALVVAAAALLLGQDISNSVQRNRELLGGHIALNPRTRCSDPDGVPPMFGKSDLKINLPRRGCRRPSVEAPRGASVKSCAKLL